MGRVFNFEGTDGCGKTTQIGLIKERLESAKFSVKTYSFPSGSDEPIPQLIQQVLRGESKVDKHTLYLMFAADRYSMQSQLIQWVCDYDFVLLDRYSASGIAYGTASGLPELWCRCIESRLYKATDIMLDVDPSMSLSRRASDGIKHLYDADIQLQRTVRAMLKFLIPESHRVDASKPINEVNDDIMEIICNIR